MNKFTPGLKRILVFTLIFGTVFFGFGMRSEAGFLNMNLERLMRNGLSACGSTLYVWGGGWDESDTGSGETAVMDGVYPGWKEYFNANRKGYNYNIGKEAWQRGSRDQRFNGLDCSGFLGWNIYNSLEGDRDSKGYVTSSKQFASSLSSRGYGSITDTFSPNELLPGDIISLPDAGHVFMVVGVCEDDSVLIMHSTPGGGVQVSGLCYYDRDNIATELAREFMSQNYPQWWESFSKEGTYKKNASAYLKGIRFSWSYQILKDSQGLRGRSGEEMMEFLNGALKDNSALEPMPNPFKEEVEGTVYRLLSLTSGEHLYTTDKNEVKTLLTKGWIQEASLGISQGAGLEIYRLYNIVNGEHLYTADKNEASVLISLGTWFYDNGGEPVFYGRSEGDIKVFRLFNPSVSPVSSHHYTRDTNEINTLLGMGWQYDNGGLPVFTL